VAAKTSFDTPFDEFVQRLSHQVPDRYRHGVRYFGLLAPRTKARLCDLIFYLLDQPRGNIPRRLPWAISLQRQFGVNPLLDSAGQPMRWSRRLSPNRDS
jgi:hypothetical protein